MKIDDCFYLGYVSKVIGNTGELTFKLDVDSPSSYNGINAVFLQMHQKDKNLIPFFIESAIIQNNGTLRCKVENIDSTNEAKNLVGKSLFLPLAALPKLEGNKFYFHEIIGFTVEDSNYGLVGKIEKVLEFPKSNLLSILINDKEVLIPINDDTIISINREDKKLVTSAPDGLIELYLEG